MWEVIDALVAAGTTVLLTTQYLDEADRLADRIAVLAGGRIVAEGTPTDLKRQIPGEQVVLGFADDAGLDAALAAIATPGATVDRDRRTVIVTTDGTPAAVKALLDRLDTAGVAVDSLDLRRPSLDDVFFLLTAASSADASDSAAVPTEGGRAR
jgi:ABC-2 type transport system ATP-binding protein